MKRILKSWVAYALCMFAALASGSCGDSASNAEAIAVFIESQDRIVSENGELELRSGTLAIKSISLLGDGTNVPLIGAAVVDVAVSDHELPLVTPIPPGAYTGLLVELGPATEDTQTLDVQVSSIGNAEAVRAISALTMSGQVSFPEGPRSIAESSDIRLQLNLSGMFFYLNPLSDAVDGVYEAGESQRGLLTMNLTNMFDLRVLP